MRLGHEVPAADNVALTPARHFEVRRMDRFLRWLLGFAGDAVPVAPPEAVSAWHDLVHATQRAHAQPPVVSTAAEHA